MRILSAALFLSLSLASSTSHADLLVKLRELGANRVEVSLSGTGIVGGISTIGTINNLDFVDFLGLTPYGPGIAPDGSGDGHVFSLASTPMPLTLTVRPGEVDEFSQSYESIRLDNEGTSSDFSLIGVGTMLPIGEPYEAAGAAIVEFEQGGSGEPLKFSDLNPGTYFTDSAFDAGVFGGVTLEIVPIPEASALLSVGLAMGIMLHRKSQRLR